MYAYECSILNLPFYLWEVAVSFSWENLLFWSRFSDSRLALISLTYFTKETKFALIELTLQRLTWQSVLIRREVDLIRDN